MLGQVYLCPSIWWCCGLWRQTPDLNSDSLMAPPDHRPISTNLKSDSWGITESDIHWIRMRIIINQILHESFPCEKLNLAYACSSRHGTDSLHKPFRTWLISVHCDGPWIQTLLSMGSPRSPNSNIRARSYSHFTNSQINHKQSFENSRNGQDADFSQCLNCTLINKN